MTKIQLLIIAIATLLTIIGWVAFDALHKRSAVTVSSEVQDIIEPINPDFDLQPVQFNQ